MKMHEVTQSKITRNAGNKVEIDHGDGTATTVDTKKNPDAISRDEKGNVKLNKNIGNSSMNGKKNTPKPPRPGEKIAIDNEN
jgi:hypothetical protein|tara:strand:+ start:2464 stop:2709 length:246 start_codon:yes stop_codon:yes gene_type:complete